uniref:Thyroglobulin type-1 domain-containing protein n=1 Tax=Anopheles atroparvus TaxID=41427 RepID=A0A182INC5_ANOAO
MKQIDRLLDKCLRRHGALVLLVAGLLCLQITTSDSTPLDDAGPSSASVSSSETAELTACQHLRRAEARRAKSLGDSLLQTVRIPRCTALGDFEPVQCSNELNGTECWCVDEYGVEITGSRRSHADDVNCTRVENHCQASSCRMFCPAGFAKDPSSGCPVCRCRDPCEDVQCPRGQQCEPQEVQCKAEPCPPIPTCRKARSLSDLCPAGQPLAISGTVRPFLCGTDPGKPSCPPLYRCLVQGGNDYGVCCPASLQFEKPGSCPRANEIESTANTGYLCGTPCGHDLECPQMQKCCQSDGCGRNCQQPPNVTACHQARMLSELLSVNEREGRGYVPQCEGPGGSFSTRQCSRNGLVCWCVDPKSGNKLKGTMGAAGTVSCEGLEKLLAAGRAGGRSVDGSQTLCDHNICAAVCEYGFKNDHNGCPTCECSEPCEGYLCPAGSHCEVAKDPKCEAYSGLCSSEPVCKPDLVYSNPCEIGTPLADNSTGELLFCHMDRPKSREYQSRSFFDDEELEAEENGRKRSMSNTIMCPAETHECRKLHGESRSVCCPLVTEGDDEELTEERQQTMCEYLRDFSDRMEGTVEGMELALPPPACTTDGGYQAMQCVTRKTKVKLSEQRKYIEQNSIRRMRKLLEDAAVAAGQPSTTMTPAATEPSARVRRSANPAPDSTLKLIPVGGPEQLMPGVQARSAKIIDFNRLESKNGNTNLDKPEVKPSTLLKRPLVTPTLPTPAQEQLVEVEVEECWCADGFGTEIPKTRGLNATTRSCETLRETLGCLDLTCRMGCDYGFVLDPDTQCPSCECRDPCDSVTCPDGQECRSVEVSCEGEYCPPVPACFPKKPGQCPFLVPPGAENSESDSCEYECRTDAHCDGTRRCCSNGCGTQCVEPQLKTACQHLQTIQLHQASELGVPPKQKYITQCDTDGSFRTVQCGPGGACWCVDEFGNEKSGTRTVGADGPPDCALYPKTECPLLKCRPCEYGYRIDANGCKTCECRDPCGEISCPRGEECQLIQVECISVPCPKMPICVPIRESVCPEGLPLRSSGREIVCGPQTDADTCPSTHICQLNPITNRGVCCGKTRDVCFESIDQSCLQVTDPASIGNNELESIVRWRFSPRLNKCVPVTLPRGVFCQSKNLFHSEQACNGVCPVLSQCERLRLKNAMAAKRAGQPNTWFQPRCDPETGFWSPVQCLGSMGAPPATNGTQTGQAPEAPSVGVCWCADKKGAPVKGSLTKGSEPKCSSRQARRRGDSGESASSQDPVMEELIRQITFLVDENNYLVDEDLEPVPPVSVASGPNYAPEPRYIGSVSSVTERVIELARTAESRNFVSDTGDGPIAKRLRASATRCQALQLAASFPVACDEAGSFEPMQCNGDTCWCVDAAGNQLPLSSTFPRGQRSCLFTPIDVVEIELRLSNVQRHRPLLHVYETLRTELSALVGNIYDNYRVQENADGSVTLRFDLIEPSKVDDAYAIEEMVRDGTFALYHGQLVADMTQSRFAHRVSPGQPLAQPSSGGVPESTFQTIVFVLATASAFLVAVFVVFVMLKRGRSTKAKHYAGGGAGEKIFAIGADKYVDYSSPIFVLSANDSKSLQHHPQSERCSD